MGTNNPLPRFSYRKEKKMEFSTYIYDTDASAFDHIAGEMVRNLAAPCILSLNTRKTQDIYSHGLQSENPSILCGHEYGLVQDPSTNRSVQIAIIQNRILKMRQGKRPVIPIIIGKDGKHWTPDIHTAIACALAVPSPCVKDWPWYIVNLYTVRPVITCNARYGMSAAEFFDGGIQTAVERYTKQDNCPTGQAIYTIGGFMDDNNINDTTVILNRRI